MAFALLKIEGFSLIRKLQSQKNKVAAFYVAKLQFSSLETYLQTCKKCNVKHI